MTSRSVTSSSLTSRSIGGGTHAAVGPIVSASGVERLDAEGGSGRSAFVEVGRHRAAKTVAAAEAVEAIAGVGAVVAGAVDPQPDARDARLVAGDAPFRAADLPADLDRAAVDRDASGRHAGERGQQCSGALHVAEVYPDGRRFVVTDETRMLTRQGAGPHAPARRARSRAAVARRGFRRARAAVRLLARVLVDHRLQGALPAAGRAADARVPRGVLAVAPARRRLPDRRRAAREPRRADVQGRLHRARQLKTGGQDGDEGLHLSRAPGVERSLGAAAAVMQIEAWCRSSPPPVDSPFVGISGP